ncbi:uncharacterized protein LOC142346081 [Convolutriloba macropyga]|uniref:uncharacterized protein LOC142346081 n=1 Tax=Convolutriloba macropyga TaxID=536237 RepID=UPI003F51F199
MCGMGSVSRDKHLYHTTLDEAFFTVNFLQKGYIPFLEPLHFCNEREICTDKIGDVNSCLRDVGSPVYQFGCQSEESRIQFRRPLCLYGIVKPKIRKQRRNRTGEETNCSGEEIFLNVTHLLPKIEEVTRKFSFVD